jgi:hypothetical protein
MKKQTVCVIGSGWGSSSFIKNIDTEKYDVIVVSPNCKFLYTPLLPYSIFNNVQLNLPIKTLNKKIKHFNVEKFNSNCEQRKQEVIRNLTLSHSFLNDDFSQNVDNIILKAEGKEEKFAIFNPMYDRISYNNSTEYAEIYSLILVYISVYKHSLSVHILFNPFD